MKIAMIQEFLRQFLVDSNKAGYAGGNEKNWVKETDGSTTIVYEKGEWKSHDNFFGGEPFGGRTIVFHSGRPYWMMVYYGWVAERTETDFVYGVLKNALMRMPEDCPFRGPKEYKENDYTYRNFWEGDVARFSGEETIIQRTLLVYQANYRGGLVDRHRGV